MLSPFQAALNSALLSASSENDLDMVISCLKGGADINCQDKDGCSPVMLAIQNNHRLVSGYLVAEGANLDLIDEFGLTADDYELNLSM